MLLARDTEVHVRVHERREEVAPGAVDDLGARGRVQAPGGADLRDLTLPDQDVVQSVQARARIEHVRAADEEVDGGGRRADQRLHHARAPAAAGARAGARVPARTS